MSDFFAVDGPAAGHRVVAAVLNCLGPEEGEPELTQTVISTREGLSLYALKDDGWHVQKTITWVDLIDPPAYVDSEGNRYHHLTEAGPRFEWDSTTFSFKQKNALVPLPGPVDPESTEPVVTLKAKEDDGPGEPWFAELLSFRNLSDLTREVLLKLWRLSKPCLQGKERRAEAAVGDLIGGSAPTILHLLGYATVAIRTLTLDCENDTIRVFFRPEPEPESKPIDRRWFAEDAAYKAMDHSERATLCAMFDLAIEADDGVLRVAVDHNDFPGLDRDGYGFRLRGPRLRNLIRRAVNLGYVSRDKPLQAFGSTYIYRLITVRPA